MKHLKFFIFLIIVVVTLSFPYQLSAQCTHGITIKASNLSTATVNSLRIRDYVTGTTHLFTSPDGIFYTLPNMYTGNNWFIEVQISGHFASLMLTYPTTPPWDTFYFPSSSGTSWYLTFDGPIPQNNCISYTLYIH